MTIGVRRNALRRGTSLLGAIVAIIASAVIVGSLPSSAESAGPTTLPTSWKKKPATKRERDAKPEKPKTPPKWTPTSPATQQATSTPAVDQATKPEVEVYIPSVARLRQAAVKSRTADIYRGLAGMIPAEMNETGEGMDLAAVFELLDRVADWPDTSLAMAIYRQDREGRPRWAVRLDWPLATLRERVEEILEADAAKQLLKEIKLSGAKEGTFRLELPDHLLAVLSAADGEGSFIASEVDVKPPVLVFGQAAQDESADDSDAAKKKPRRLMLLYSRLNLGTGGDDGPSPFARLSGVRDVCYGLSLGNDGLWSEKIVVSWNPLVGTAMKMAFRKTDKPFECPKKSYGVAAFNLGLGEGMADAVCGLSPGTIGGKASGEAAVSIVPGGGFFPFPDIYFQFYTSKKDKIIESVREAIDQDTKKRKVDDRPPAWREQQLGDGVVFWRDPSADRPAGLMPVTYRTVLFFDALAEDETGKTRLIVAQASTRAEEAVAHWRELMKSKASRISVPDSSKAHWQGRISWRSTYALLQPYLCLLTSLAADASLPPTPEEMEDALVDAVIDIRVEYAGLQIRHSGPIPAGAIYVPGIVAASLGSSASMWSEAGREQIACRHLRVLHHHAKLFNKDYGRWPATVAELDGYVDFASHPDLLYLRQQDRSFVERFAATFTAGKRPAEGLEEGELDDSLYQIDWTPGDWKLSFRDGEFKNHATIYIDKEGEIHRVPKPQTSQPASAAADRHPQACCLAPPPTCLCPTSLRCKACRADGRWGGGLGPVASISCG